MRPPQLVHVIPTCRERREPLVTRKIQAVPRALQHHTFLKKGEQMPKQACARLLAGAALLLMAMEPAEFAGHVGGCGRLSNATRLFLADRCRLLLAHILPPQIAADLCASSPLPPPPSARARAT